MRFSVLQILLALCACSIAQNPKDLINDIKLPKGFRIELFAKVWLHNGERLGRPVDILEMEDGSLLIRNDKTK